MEGQKAINTSQGKGFNTLAQNGTQPYKEVQQKNPILVAGKGSELVQASSKKRAKRKSIGSTMALTLISLAESKREFNRLQPFWNTYHCQGHIVTANGNLYGKYCKNRFCPLCNSIRKADLINKYLPVIEQWKEPYFVTLTISSVKKGELRNQINEMLILFRRITAKYRKRHQRGGGIKLIGIRSLECNYNPMKKSYNPHFHAIVKDREMARTLIVDWQRAWGKKRTNFMGQQMKRIDNPTSCMIEVIKYGTKIFTDLDVMSKSKKGNAKVYAAAMDTILRAMKGHRIFDRFGF